MAISFPQQIFVQLLRVIHFAIAGFSVFGWVFSSASARIVHLAFIPIMILHWRTNQNTCALTNLERRLRGESAVTPTERPSGFVKENVERFMPTAPSEKRVNQAIYLTLALSWSLSLARLLID